MFSAFKTVTLDKWNGADMICRLGVVVDLCAVVFEYFVLPVIICGWTL